MTAIEGRVWKFGDNISADDGIIQYSQVPDLGTFDIPALKAMCFTGLMPDFPEKVRAGDIIVAGRNFGHHSHPHACVAMKESGIAAVLVESCNSAFVRKALNIGLPVIPCRGVSGLAEEGDVVRTDLATGEVTNSRTGKTLHYRPFAELMIEVWRAGDLASALKTRLAGSADVAENPRPGGRLNLWEITVAGFLAIVGIYLIAGGISYEVGTPRNMGAGFFPVAIGAALLVVALAVMFELRRRPKPRPNCPGAPSAL